MSSFTELNESQLRQFIDAEAVFRGHEEATEQVLAVRGSMIWKTTTSGRYLVRTSSKGAQKSLGRDGPEQQRIYADFHARKGEAETRLRALAEQLDLQERLNRAQRVGRVPGVVINVLSEIAAAGLGESFVVIGTHALYAYEAAAGVRFQDGAVATRDVDLLFNMEKRLAFSSGLARLDTSLLSVLRRADPSFRLVEDQKYTAQNDSGYQVDIVRRVAGEHDPHPYRMSGFEEDFWPVQVAMGSRLMGARPFEHVVVATTGAMALMRTIHPLDFARIKRDLAGRIDREPLKRRKDLMQAEAIEGLVSQYLPQLKERVEPVKAPDQSATRRRPKP
ncbi:hypothetical protein CBP36_19525 (plasmid) [Acidovorax carolinensis]|jgi:hypothetical protein|uniref:Nucleotidyltransferase-like domain-containing protein n=1 Tax=Acidovorax carolinensis TaxID=553814 RepID=A0A240UJF7_9BURK|nr:GSU2403 family nucleotidyltransferase fold protein [Acidovorax carolinensis]ART57097.1 hypothetical protein CBP35_19475 [Acidovorax carolinensis]ART61159.1 hypothetical protein CBP36_19525 [Acidovorax carolinensis]